MSDNKVRIIKKIIKSMLHVSMAFTIAVIIATLLGRQYCKEILEACNICYNIGSVCVLVSFLLDMLINAYKAKDLHW